MEVTISHKNKLLIHGHYSQGKSKLTTVIFKLLLLSLSSAFNCISELKTYVSKYFSCLYLQVWTVCLNWEPASLIHVSTEDPALTSLWVVSRAAALWATLVASVNRTLMTVGRLCVETTPPVWTRSTLTRVGVHPDIQVQVWVYNWMYTYRCQCTPGFTGGDVHLDIHVQVSVYTWIYTYTRTLLLPPLKNKSLMSMCHEVQN